jgi:hypothetical protein
MNIDANALLASFLVGAVGFVLVAYGKKQARYPHMAVGLALMVYPYFVSSAALILVIGAVLCALLWGVSRLGW